MFIYEAHPHQWFTSSFRSFQLDDPMAFAIGANGDDCDARIDLEVDWILQLWPNHVHSRNLKPDLLKFASDHLWQLNTFGFLPHSGQWLEAFVVGRLLWLHYCQLFGSKVAVKSHPWQAPGSFIASGSAWWCAPELAWNNSTFWSFLGFLSLALLIRGSWIFHLSYSDNSLS